MTRKNRRGFTLVEVMVAVSIMVIMTAVIAFSADFTKQTAKREAQRLAVFIYRAMKKAERRRMNFEITASPARAMLTWPNGEYEILKPTTGCTYSNNFPNYGLCSYNARKKRYTTGGTITVKDSDGIKHYVILAGINEDRVRLSETRP